MKSMKRWTRREAMHLMGAGGAALVAGCSGEPAPTPGVETGAVAGDTSSSPVIRTRLGDISPDQIDGATLFHEHLSIKMNEDMVATDDVDNIVREIRTASGEGVGCIVDGGHPDLGRDLDACRRVANETDVHVVVSGGYYTEAFYPPDLAEKSDDEIADGLVAEAIRDRLGAFGEIGQTSNVAEMTPLERKVFQAIGKAHVQSGIPIFTHNAYGTGENVTPDQGLEQLDVLESVGVDPRIVAIGHACCLDDPSAAEPTSASTGSRAGGSTTRRRLPRFWLSLRVATPTACSSRPTTSADGLPSDLATGMPHRVRAAHAGGRCRRISDHRCALRQPTPLPVLHPEGVTLPLWLTGARRRG